VKFKYDVQALQWMSLFEKVTRAKLKDFFMQQEKLCFIVQPGNLRKGLGPNKKNIEKLEGLTKRKVKVIEYSDDIKRFISNVFSPLKIVKMEFGDDGIVTLTGPDQKTKGLMIGAQARNLRLFESVVQKYYPEVKEIKVI
jgi:N utilization substance protein A